MFRVKVVQRACLAIVATLVVASCGTGTESAQHDQSDGRNVALADDNGLPFPGLSGYLDNVAIEPATEGAWVGGRYVNSGLMTGGIALYQDPKFLTIDPTFPRITGAVRAINFNAANSEIVIGGSLKSVGSRNGMQPRRGLAFLNPNGLRDVNVSFNGRVDSIARIGNEIYVASDSTQVVDEVTGFIENTKGLHRIDTRTGRLLPQPVLEGIGRTTDVVKIAPGRLVSPDAVKMAVVVRDWNSFTLSLVIYNVVTGTMQKLLASGQNTLDIQSIENGYALVKMQRPFGAPGWLYRVLDIEAGGFVGVYDPVAQQLQGAYAGEGRVRVVGFKSGTYSLIDLNPRTLAPLKTTPLPEIQAPRGAPSDIAWAGQDATLFANGALYSFSTNEFQYLRTISPDDILAAAFVPGRGLLVGGYFGTAIETPYNELVRIPDEGRVYGVRDIGDEIYSLADMVSTPRGPVAIANGNSVWLIGRDTTTPPTKIARFTPSDTCSGFDELYSAGTSVFASGCWNDFTVNDVSTSDPIVEIDVSGNTPRIVRTFRTGFEQAVDIAATQNYLFVSTSRDLVIAYSRSTGQEVGRRFFDGRMFDLLGVTRNGTDILLAGGEDLVMGDTGFVPAPLLQLTVTDQSAVQLRLSPANLAGGGITTLAVDTANIDPAGPRYVYAAGAKLRVAGQDQSIVQLDFDTGGPNPQMSFASNSYVADVAVHKNKLWAVGNFETVVVNNRTYRTSRVAAYNLESHKLFERGTIPLVTTTTTPPTTLAPAVAPAVDSVDSAPTTSTIDPDDALTGPPVGPTPPPLLPNTGDAAPGTYSVESNGVRSEVRVLPDGTVRIISIDQSATDTGLMITKLVPGSRTVKVTWRPTNGKPVYKVTTGTGKARRTCTTTKNSCTVKNLDPWKAYVFVVEATKGKTKSVSPVSPRLKPFVSVKKGSSTKVSTIAPQGAKGKATWTTSNPCAVKNAKLVAPRKAGRCTVTVTVGKSTRKVNVRVG